MARISHTLYLLILSTIFTFWWFFLAISPYDRADWALENALVVAAVVLIAFSFQRFTLSRISYTLIFLFLCLHEIGAHYTYAEVPYEKWLQAVFSFSLHDYFDFQRNHFDRLAHFCYGLLLAYPIREIFIRIVGVKGFWGYFLPLDLTMSTSMIFELFEWGAAALFAGDLGMAYLGTQGDIWDAHRDMALASFGALIAMLLTACINIRLQKDFKEEWRKSLQVKGQAPLGEDEITRMWKRKMKES